METLPVPADGVVLHLTGGEYGWGYEELRGALEKLDYCATQAFVYGSEYEQNVLREVVRQQTGLEISFVADQDAYIDHQSVGIVSFQDSENLRQIIFNPNYVIVIDNDNH